MHISSSTTLLVFSLVLITIVAIRKRNQRIRKKDVDKFVINSRRFSGFLVLLTALVPAVLYFTVNPRLISLYQSLNSPNPYVENLNTAFIVVMITLTCTAIYLFSTKPSLSEVKNQLKHYKDNAMVQVKEIRQFQKLQLALLVGIGIMIGYLVLFVLCPSITLIPNCNLSTKIAQF